MNDGNTVTKQRNANIDLIKCIAALSVISVHFFWNAGYYTEPMIGKRMLFMTFMRTSFMVCVPLFLIITGYLMSGKKLSAKYFYGIVHTIVMYIIISLFCLLYKHIGGQELSLKEAVKGILDYTAAPYAWYVEMYIGLFVMIPFLNILYQNLENRKAKRFLLFILSCMIVVPTIFNIDGSKYVPAYWTGIWPILYYFIGCYIREYKPKIPLKLNLFLIVVILIFSTVFNYIRCFGECFEFTSYNDWYGWQNFVSTVLVFLFVNNLDLSRIPALMKKVFSYVAKLSLGIYLASWIVDDWYYSRLLTKVPVMISRLEYFPVSVCFVFIFSLLLASAGDAIQTIIMNLLGKLLNFKGHNGVKR